jgi:hypothetical protein
MASVGPVKLHSDISGRHLVRLGASAESRHAFVGRLRIVGLDPDDRGQDWLSAGRFPDYPSVPTVIGDGGTEAKSEVAYAGADHDAEPPGFLEVLADMEDAFPELTAVTVEIGAEIEAMGTAARKSTEALQANEQKGGGAKAKLAIAVKHADDLKISADSLESLVGKAEPLAESVTRGSSYLLDRIETDDPCDEDYDEAVALGFLDTQIAVGAVITESVEALTGMLETMSALEAAARPIKRQVIRIRTALERYIDSISAIQGLASRAARIKSES